MYRAVMISIYAPEKVSPVGIPGAVALITNAFGTSSVVESTRQLEPSPSGMVGVAAIPGSLPLIKTQLGNGLHLPFELQVTLRLPPTFL